MEKYKLQYLNSKCDILAVKQLHGRNGYNHSDFYVWAIKESTNAKEHDAGHRQRHEYTEPMTLAESKIFISLFSPNNAANGRSHRCIGLILEDECKDVDFDKTNQVELKAYER